jgi:hypothetical protein
MKKARYYDWVKTLSFDADVTMVIGARGIGKTYGLRLQDIRDFIKGGYRFVEVVRFKNELSDVEKDYFGRIESNEEFKNKIFKTDSHYAFIADKPEADNKKPEWRMFGYFIALTQAQNLKKRTFNKVKRIIFDEAVLERRDRYHRYLSGEYGVLSNVIDTVSRERADVESVKPHLYLLGNALDVMNPYFLAYNVGIPKEGYTWHKNKTMILHYVKDAEYSKAKAVDTVAGRMLAGTEEGDVANNNNFALVNEDFVMKKTKCSTFSFGLIYYGKKYGIWEDWVNGYYFVTDKIPKNTAMPIFSLTLDDNRLNYIAARKAEELLKGFTELYYCGVIRYESIRIREEFKEILELFGVR